MRDKKSTLIGRRKVGIIVTAILALVLIVALIFVIDYVNTTTVVDPADEHVYYIRKKDKVYSLYDTDKKTIMPTVEQLGYYETHAGTVYRVDAETGEYELIAMVDTVAGNENLGINGRVLIFKHLQKEDLLSLEVHNEHGTFTFQRANAEGELDKDGDFIIKGSPLTSYDQELFASLHVSAAYTITTHKITDPLEPSEYGLVAEARTRELLDEDGEFVLDENGNYIYETYNYEPAYYILTEKSGATHKMIIGDMLVTGGGYYVQYVEADGSIRPTVYVLDSTFGETMLAPIEDFVTPQLTYPMTINTYTNVENFFIISRNPNATGDDDYFNDPIVSFTFIPLDQRENTIASSQPYVFSKGFELNGYEISSDNISVVTQALYQPSFGDVVKLLPSMDDFCKYGLATATVGTDGNTDYEFTPEYVISFNYDILNSDTGETEGTVNNRIMVSKRTDDGKYYAYTSIYEVDDKGKLSEEPLYDLNMIVEVADHTLEFLTWDRFDWIDDSIVSLNLSYADSITINDHKTGYNASFKMDNSMSDYSESVNSNYLVVHATDSNGNDMRTFARLVVTDTSGNVWTITADEIKCVSPTGTDLKITSSSYSYNKLGKQVRINKGAIQCADGRQVTVNEDTIDISGTTILRYDTSLFRKFYQTLLYASISDTYEVSEAEHAQITKDENLLVSMTIKDTEGGVKDYKFYRLTNRKVYITINGTGGFYMLNDRVQKIISDAQKFFAGQIIDETAKY